MEYCYIEIIVIILGGRVAYFGYLSSYQLLAQDGLNTWLVLNKRIVTQPAITYSKLTIETLKKLTVVLVSLLLTLNIFHTLF